MSTPNLVSPMMNWANAIASRTDTDMFLTTWGGESLTAYYANQTLATKLRSVTIPPGTLTVRVPKTWKAGSEVHEPGAELLGQDFETGYEEYSLDPRPVVSSHYFDSIQELLSSYNIRGPVTQAQGEELAVVADKRAYALLYNAAVAANDTDDSFPGALNDSTLSISNGVYTNNNLDVIHYSGPSSANVATAAEALIAGIDAFNIAADDNFLPKSGRYCVVDARLFYAARKYGITPVPIAASSASFGGTTQMSPFGAPGPTVGVGYDAELEYNGVRIFLSQNSPWNTNVTTGNSLWQMSSNSNVRAICFHQDAAVFAQYMGPVAEMDYITERQQHLILTKAMHGGGTLRRGSAMLLKGNGS